MSWNSNDYDGITFASEARGERERAEAREDARDAARAAELRAEALECAENDEAEEREALTAWKTAHPIEEILNDWRRAVTQPRTRLSEAATKRNASRSPESNSKRIEAVRAATIGRHHSAEARARISSARKNAKPTIPVSETTRAKLSAATKKVWETRRKS